LKVESKISSERADEYLKKSDQAEDTQYKNIISSSNELIEEFELSKISFKNETEMLVHLKKNISKIKKYLELNYPDRLEPFLLSIHQFIIIFFDKSLRKYSELEFFTKKDSTIIIQEWSEDGIVPYFYFLRDSLTE
jgi:hypothetical protein